MIDDRDTNSAAEELLPRALLEEWTVPDMPETMKDRVMAQLDEPWSMAVAPGPNVRAPNNSLATFIAVAALAASVASVVIGLHLADRDPPEPQAAPAPEVLPVAAAPEPEALPEAAAPDLALEPEVRGPLDRAAIRRVVRDNIHDVRHCYAQGLVRDPALTGKVVVQFTIGPSGKVVTSAVKSSTLPDATVGTCIADAVKRWTFPAPEGGGNVVEYPFLLEPG